jgi:hypothetical protein
MECSARSNEFKGELAGRMKSEAGQLTRAGQPAGEDPGGRVVTSHAMTE